MFLRLDLLLQSLVTGLLGVMQSVFTQLDQRIFAAGLERRDSKENVAHNLIGLPPSSCVLVSSPLGLLFPFITVET